MRLGSAALPVNAWSHLAATFDGSVVRLFVNGVSGGFVGVLGVDGGVDWVVAAGWEQHLG